MVPQLEKKTGKRCWSKPTSPCSPKFHNFLQTRPIFYKRSIQNHKKLSKTLKDKERLFWSQVCKTFDLHYWNLRLKNPIIKSRVRVYNRMISKVTQETFRQTNHNSRSPKKTNLKFQSEISKSILTPFFANSPKNSLKIINS